TALLIPHVNTVERAQQLVQATKFPPIGDRGVAGDGMDAGFWVGISPDYTDCANRETFLAVQIETPLAIKNVEAIAAVEGIDLLFLGPGDLSLRLGCQPSLHDPKLRAAAQALVSACDRNGKAWGYPAVKVEEAERAKDLGCRFLVLGSAFWGV